MRSFLGAVFVIYVCSNGSAGQVLTTRPAESAQPSSNSIPAAAQAQSIPLTVPAGTPLKVALDTEVRIRKVGQEVHGRLVEPIYAFDELVVPPGSEVVGKVSEIEGVSKRLRTVAAMNANFSPPHEVHIEFYELRMVDGRRIPLETVVSPGSQGALQLVTAGGKGKEKKTAAAKNLASRKISEVRQEIKREWNIAKRQIHEPGKMHRLERYGVAQLPIHPQYIESGTSYNAELQQALDFGAEMLHPEALAAIGTAPPSGSVLHALLITPLNSATSKKGDAVEAVISQPLFAANHLFLPQGSHLKGAVLEVRPARRLGHNGQLRIVFHEVTPPGGIEQNVEASLEAVEAAKGQHLSLDSEGGAQVTTPPTRYLTTAISVLLATSSMHEDHDRGLQEHGGDTGGGAVNGASGFRLIGTLVGAFAHSRVVSSGFGFYGAGMSVYSHFLARGRDVVYPKDMSMVIGLGTRGAAPAK
jgi:hypothetical protein